MLEVTSPALHNLLITQANKQTIDHGGPWQEVDYQEGIHIRYTCNTLTSEIVSQWPINYVHIGKKKMVMNVCRKLYQTFKT